MDEPASVRCEQGGGQVRFITPAVSRHRRERRNSLRTETRELVMASAPHLPSLSDIRQSITSFPGKLRQSIENFSCVEFVKGWRNSNRVIVFVVFVAIYVDNMLTTSVVPIIPTYLFQHEHPKDFLRIRYKDNSSGLSPDPMCQNISSSLPFNQTVPSSISDHCIIPAERMREMSQEKLDNQSTRIGLLFASKTAIQLIANPCVGVLTNRIGYSIPMFTGFIIIFVSTIVFACGTNYWVLLIARAVQGAGSACSSVSGMGLIAEKYQDNSERGNAMAIALSGLALGVLIGPPFGGFMYQYLGKPAPFIFLAILALLDGGLQLYVMRPSRTPEQQEGASIIQLLKDPYILITAGAITFGNMGIGMLEPTLPVYMLETMNAKNVEQGAAFLSSSVSYLIGTLIFGPISLVVGRWLAACIGMVIISISLFTVPLSTHTGHLVAPLFGLGFAIGMVDSSMMPTMGYLVDLRHVSVYGSVYAIADVAFCLGFSLGPAVGGVIQEAIGFKWMLWIIAIINLLYAPLLYFLRNPPGNAEKVSLLAEYSLKSPTGTGGEMRTLVMNDKCPIKYTTYRQSSLDDLNVEHGKLAEETTSVQVDEYNFNTRSMTTSTVRYTHRSVDNHSSSGSSSSNSSESESENEQRRSNTSRRDVVAVRNLSRDENKTATAAAAAAEDTASGDDSGETEGADSEDDVSTISEDENDELTGDTSPRRK